MESLEKYSESAIIEQIKNGENALYAQLVRKYNDYLYKVGRSYNFDHDDTLDLMQEAFIDAFISLKQFEGRSAFKTWLIRIMLNKCYHLKKKTILKTEAMEDIDETAEPAFSSTNRSVEKIIEGNELNHIIEKVLSHLSLPYRMVFTLREINGLSTAETAEALDISLSNVKVRLRRSKEMLKNELEKSYNPASLFEFNLIYCDAMVNRVMNKINQL